MRIESPSLPGESWVRALAAATLLAVSGASFAQATPSTGATQRDGAQPTGTILQPERQLNPQLQPPPQNPQTFGAPLGGPIQETGNYGSLGLGQQKQGPGDNTQRGLVQPDYRTNDTQRPSPGQGSLLGQ
jgi:hypothetical protein